MDPILQSQLKDWVLMAAVLIMAVWMLIIVSTSIRRKEQSAMQKALLDKFSSASDFAEFMQSPAGQKYVMSFTDAMTSPRNAILNSIKTGFVAMFVGMGFLVGGAGADSISFRIGWILFLAGIGFLISSAVSYFLAKKSGWKEQG